MIVWLSARLCIIIIRLRYIQEGVSVQTLGSVGSCQYSSSVAAEIYVNIPLHCARSVCCLSPVLATSVCCSLCGGNEWCYEADGIFWAIIS